MTSRNTQPEGAELFEFEFERRYRLAATPFGIPKRCHISLTGTTLLVRFGPWMIHTPRSNIASSEITGPYAFVKTAGPARLSVSDRGLTFATNSRSGLCLSFHTPIVGIDPMHVIRHPNLTITPKDPAALRRALELPEK